MKRLFTFLIIIMSSLAFSAQEEGQNLIVYDVGGNVTNIRKRQPVEKRQQLSLKDQISIPADGFIKLLDKDKQRMFTLKDKCKGSVSALIASQKNAERSLTKQYFAYILRSMTRKDIESPYNSGLTTASFRNDADSLLCDIDSLQTVVDSLNNVITTLTTDSTNRK
jgi:hypothetical protein